MARKSSFNRASIFTMAWRFVKRNGFTLSEALKTAWLNAKLKVRMATAIVQFFFTKRDGSIRQAFGTLQPGVIGETKGTGRKPNDNLQVYWDTEKGEYRCFVTCNLLKVV